MTSAGAGVRLAELVASLSLATDLGLGQPQQHIIRQTLIAMRIGKLEDLSEAKQDAIFYVSLLAWVGCVADAHEMGKWFGDDMAVRADSFLVDMTHVIEQQAYVRAGERIDDVDLLCSGFIPEVAADPVRSKSNTVDEVISHDIV